MKQSPVVRFIINSLKHKQGLRRYIGPKRVISFIILLYSLFFLWSLYKQGWLSPEIILQQKSVHPLRAIALFLTFYIISIVFLLPSLPLNLAGGFFWGGVTGGLLSTFGVTIGSWISFYLARVFIGEVLAESFENKWLSIIQEEFEQNDWKFVAFARLNPIIPTGPLNYILGLTSMSNRSYIAVTFLSLLAPSVAIAYIGNVIHGFALGGTNQESLMRNIIIGSLAVTMLAFLRVAHKIIRKGSEK